MRAPTGLTRCNPWPWIDASAEATCTDALKTLRTAGVLAVQDPAWLEPALKRGIGAPRDLTVPWAAWAVRIVEHARLPVTAGMLAIAVTALNAGRSEAAIQDQDMKADDREAPDDLVRSSIAAAVLNHAASSHPGFAGRIASWLVGLGKYPVASAPKNPPVGWMLRAHASPGVREAVVLWTAPTLLTGEDIGPWSRFGQTLAEPITLLSDLARLWLDPAMCDVRDASLTALVQVWLRNPVLGRCLLRGYAGERSSEVRRLEIHRFLASEPFRDHLAHVRHQGLAAAQANRPTTGGAGLIAAAADFVDALGHGFRFFESLMAFYELVDRSHASAAAVGPPVLSDRALTGDAETDVRVAVTFLSDSAPWSESWEVQRFGIFGSEHQPVSQWFVRGMILRALLEMGHDVRGEARRLLSEIPSGELRYYGPWPDIPPDADDLGLMLELAARTGSAPDHPETWIVLLWANLDERGVAPTWFSRDAAGRPTTPSDRSWRGDDCNAVRLNLLCGLLAFDAARFDDVIQANATRILECSAADGVGGVYYYDPYYAALAFLRFERLYCERAVSRSLSAPLAVTAAAIRARIVRSQRLDGGWGSPQRTAFCLQGYAINAEAPADERDTLLLQRGLRYLGEHQLVDGSWPAEPFYLIPVKRDREGQHQGRALTTAFCAHALHTALAALPH